MSISENSEQNFQFFAKSFLFMEVFPIDTWTELELDKQK